MKASLKKTKSKPPTILEEESCKLKQKIQLLKEQVALKKLQKQMNKTVTSIQSAVNPLSHTQQNKMLTQTIKINLSLYSDSRFHNFLVENKLESLQGKLKEKQVKSLERFLSLTEEQIDQWKDLAVGWRIKLKRKIRNCEEKSQSQSQSNGKIKNLQKSSLTNCSFSNACSLQQQQQVFRQPKKQVQSSPLDQKTEKNIEDIIKQRKQIQIFMPIQRKIQQLEESEESFITQEDQDVIIQSFMDVFQPRKGILNQLKQLSSLSKAYSIKKNKKISWSKQVETMQKETLKKNHKTYPKQAIARQVLIHKSDEKTMQSSSLLEQRKGQQTQYCWKCFKKIQIKQNLGMRIDKDSQQSVDKYFCSEKCHLLFSQQMSKFGDKIRQCREETGEIGKDQKSCERDQSEQDFSIIDLQIL